ncbi:4-hydroxy-tetrahydrodipicolinate synthase [Methanothermococcus okinawensis]|uniref:4-hydroxy-tetrahydrodipicolinate synthase n=1 Tax=Methanothermococcus okinawensis (strain DSM 14208 / JCM 11175 / IH1) TaxID=647113 RepID=F8AJN9_METOI|nr:4-hydroxy-tetrahydrodipicolinate synthase [Methanothermococcus okinawensis]AEH07233.1 Dihydrodipicolinate synthase [Methanothermococcus okinawensis IH1]
MQGVFPAIVTPFKDGGVYYEGLEKNINFLIDNGVSGIVSVGTTGESPTLTYEEHQKVIEKAVDTVNGKVKVIAGSGSNSTKEAIELSQFAEDVGADAVLLITPYYNKPTQEGLKKHFGKIAESINIPIVLYNVPSRTAVNLEPETIKYLYEEYSNITTVKEANPNLSQVSEIVSSCDINVLSGNDELTLPIISLGGKGVISVLANIVPKEFVEMVDYALEGKFDKAREIHCKLFNLMKLMFVETNPIPIKTAMNMLNMPAGELRLPLCEMSQENKLKLESALIEAGLLKKKL